MDSKDEMLKMFAAMHKGMSEDEPREHTRLLPEIVANKLTDLLKDLHAPQDLHVGDIIQWKKGLKNLRIPDYGEPVIVSEVLVEPLLNTETPLFMGDSFITFTHKIFCPSPQGDEMSEYLVDVRRFEKVPQGLRNIRTPHKK